MLILGGVSLASVLRSSPKENGDVRGLLSGSAAGNRPYDELKLLNKRIIIYVSQTHFGAFENREKLSVRDGLPNPSKCFPTVDLRLPCSKDVGLGLV